jgi:DNA-binding response OmpR family regulator
VDDDPDIRDVLEEVLTDSGYDVACVENGQVALDYLQNSPPPDAILLDLFMPVMSGWDFARRIRRQPELAGIPLVLITACEPYWGYPGSEVLRKPLDLDRLLQTLRTVIERDPTGGAGGSPTRPSSALRS